jgi:hypothetical protein
MQVLLSLDYSYWQKDHKGRSFAKRVHVYHVIMANSVDVVTVISHFNYEASEAHWS